MSERMNRMSGEEIFMIELVNISKVDAPTNGKRKT